MSTTGTQHVQQPQTNKIAPIMTVLLIGAFIDMFSETTLNMALDDLIHVFDISPSTAQWLTSGYSLVLGIFIPISALLFRRISTRTLVIVSLIVSILGLLIEATAFNFPILLAGRIVQAIGSGLVIPLLFNAVFILFPPHQRGTAMGMVSLVQMFAPALGPTVAGFIIVQLNWHYIFWVILPFLVIALILAFIYMPNLYSGEKPGIDMLSIVLSSIGFGSIVFGFSYAGNATWTNPVVLSSLILGMLVLIVFVRRQFVVQNPVLDLNIFRYSMFTMGIVITLLSNLVIFTANILLPLYLQGGHGLSASDAGLLMLPGGIINGIMAFVNGRIFDKFGPRWLIIGGFGISVISTWAFSQMSPSTSGFTIILFFMLLMVSMSMVTTPSQTNGLNQLNNRLYPDGSAGVNTMIQVSGAVGTAIAASILSITQNTFLSQVANPSTAEHQAQAVTAGFQHAFLFAFVVSIAGLICSLFVRHVKAR